MLIFIQSSQVLPEEAKPSGGNSDGNISEAFPEFQSHDIIKNSK